MIKGQVEIYLMELDSDIHALREDNFNLFKFSHPPSGTAFKTKTLIASTLLFI